MTGNGSSPDAGDRGVSDRDEEASSHTGDGSSSDDRDEDVSTGEMVRALLAVARYRPTVTVALVSMSVVVTLLEGIGIGFLLPLVERAGGGGGGAAPTEGLVGVFASVYGVLGVPFTFGYLVAGVALVMTVRICLGFVVGWLGARLQTHYVRSLQSCAFERTLDADLEYFDEHGSDEILNALLTRVYYAESVIEGTVSLVQESLLAVMYLVIALYLAPVLTVVMSVTFGGLVYAIHSRTESAYAIGDEVDVAHERMQSSVQAGTQGIRDVKLFGLSDELYREYERAVDRYTRATVELDRNQLLIQNTYQLVTTVAVLVVFYGAVTYSSLSLGGLGMFVFAMYRLAPRINQISGLAYLLAGSLPPFVRMRAFVDELDEHAESSGGTAAIPDPIRSLGFRDVSFAHGDEAVLRGVRFEVERGEFVALVGPSGAGKSTVLSLLAGLYAPDSGRVTANGTDVSRFEPAAWRNSVSVVRQHPYLFDDTLEYNLTVGARDATESAIERACDVAGVSEFLDDLPRGLDTELGDDGVRLSGGQRQRVAIARAVLEDNGVLVLDEATSDVDAVMEDRIYRRIRGLDGDRILIAVTHRVEAVADADRIYTLGEGRIVESGSHRDLVARGGWYADRYANRHETSST